MLLWGRYGYYARVDRFVVVNAATWEDICSLAACALETLDADHPREPLNDCLRGALAQVRVDTRPDLVSV